MTLYADENYYSTTFEGTSIPNDDIEKYLKLAQEKIDDITYNRIVDIGFDNLTNFQKECIQKAMCYQAEYYYTKDNDDLSNVTSYNVLDISVTIDKSSNKTEAEINKMHKFAYSNIKKTGLASRLL